MKSIKFQLQATKMAISQIFRSKLKKSLNIMTINTNIAKAIDLLNKNEVVAIPTETVYGLAANAYNWEAVSKIYKIKNRPTFDPLIVHTDSMAKIYNFVSEIPEKMKILAKEFWPGPLTLLLKKNNLIPDIVTAGLPTVGVRIPNHSLTLNLLSKINYPLAAPSANPFGYISPTSSEHVTDMLGDKIEYTLDGGRCNIGIESTIIGFEEGEPCIYRLGGLCKNEIESAIGKVSLKIKGSNPKAPGMLDNHYSPKAQLFFGDQNYIFNEIQNKNMAIPLGDLSNVSFRETYPSKKKINFTKNPSMILTSNRYKFVLICFNKILDNINPLKSFILSKNDSLPEAAKNIFEYMRLADKFALKNNCPIYAVKLPEKGLGLAINDRLYRASYKK